MITKDPAAYKHVDLFAYAELASTAEPEPELRGCQRDLFSTGRTAAECRAEAVKIASSKLPQRKLRILELLGHAGRNGLTRYELSQHLNVQQSSICGAVLDLIATAEVVELPRKRESGVGGRGTVLVHQSFAEGT